MLALRAGRFFPFTEMHRWLSYGHGPLPLPLWRRSSLADRGPAACLRAPLCADAKDGFFVRREFSFTLEGDIYVRYKCFQGEVLGALPRHRRALNATQEDFRSQLQQKCPIKIDLGAFYNYPVRTQARSVHPV